MANEVARVIFRIHKQKHWIACIELQPSWASCCFASRDRSFFPHDCRDLVMLTQQNTFTCDIFIYIPICI